MSRCPAKRWLRDTELAGQGLHAMLDRLDFTGELWLSAGPGGWTFVTLPPACADQIRFFTGGRKGSAWGMVKVKARIGEAEWSTTIWPDKATGSFLLPVKAVVRKKEKIAAGDKVDVTLWLQVQPGF